MTHLLIARINAKMRPLDRGDVYEDPLNDALQAAGAGEVTGGGTQLSASHEVEFCDLEIESKLPLAEASPLIIQTLEKLGAPKGSQLLPNEDAPGIAFGKNEGLGLYLNGTDLPAAVYQESDINFVYDEINRLLGDSGSIQSYWEGASETALYLYGASFGGMKEKIQPLVDSYPLCQKCRIVQIA